MNTKDKLFYWLPRLLCIVAILFISMFALDAFDNRLTIWQQIGSFLIHLIPSYVLIIALIIAWRWELIGGIIFTSIGFITGPLIFYHNTSINHFSVLQSLGIVSLINLPFIIVGGLFIFNYLNQRSNLNR